MEDKKFKFEDGKFVNRVSGEAIPDDEPVILFRARDWHAIQVLEFYLSLAGDEHHRKAIAERLGDFKAFRDAFPARMKEPGITRDFKEDVPITEDFIPGVLAEMEHQVRRWGTAHDRGKEPADWFWLVGYLAGKALSAHVAGDAYKALHHTISTAAALGQWHAAINGAHYGVMPGRDHPSDIEQYVEGRFPGAADG